MTELQQSLATERTFEHEGVTYRIGAVTFEVMAAWEDWLAGETLDRMLKLLGKHRDGEEKAVAAVARLSAAGEFDYFGSASGDRMRTLSGQKKLAYFRVKQHHNSIEPRVIAEIIENDWLALHRAMLADIVAHEAVNPNAQAPAATGAKTNESAGEPSSPKSATVSDASPAKTASTA